MPDNVTPPNEERGYNIQEKVKPNSPSVPEKGEFVLPFINRDRQLDLFRGVVVKISEEAEKKPVVPHILNFWGAGGVGKSRLLKDKFSSILEQDEWRERWHYVYLTLEEGRRQESTEVIITDLQSCLFELGKKLSDKLNFSLQNPLTEAESNLPIDTQIKFAEELVVQVKRELSLKPACRLLIILDGLTQTKDWFALLEKHFLSPLIKNILVIIGSRAAVRLDRFELRLQLKPSLVKAFAYKPDDPDEKPPDLTKLLNSYFKNVKEEVGRVKNQLLVMSQHLLKLSKGHPDALRYLLELLGRDLEVAQNQLDENNNILKIDLSNYILQTYVQATGLTTQKAELQTAVREMSIYRRFDITMLQTACQSSPDPEVSGKFKTKNAAFFTQLSQDMVRTYLVDWKIEERGFVIESCYREIWAQGLQASALQARQPAQFQKRHDRAVLLYEELVKKTQDQHREESETLKLYKAELNYHKEQLELSNLP